MTYFAFLWVFLIPPIMLLAFTLPKPLAGLTSRRPFYSLPLVCLIAFIYTTPWDNYLVYRGVWGYGTERVLATIGYVPVEEYAFFLLQPILTGLFLYHLLSRYAVTARSYNRIAYVLGIFFYFAITVIGIVLLATGIPGNTYLGLILAWAGPILLGLWIYAGKHFWSLRPIFLLAIAVPTIYLWVADRIAIGLEIWYISDDYSLNWDPFGLPIEEAVFFLVTNILVVQGTLLFLHGDLVAQKKLWQSSLAQDGVSL